MHHPKKPPISCKNSARQSLDGNQNSNTWQQLIDRTQRNNVGETLKRGDYALSNKREDERVKA